MDIRAMEFETGSFDCVIDKGTLDSVLVNFIHFLIAFKPIKYFLLVRRKFNH